MTFSETEVWGFKHAIRGMRNPLNSWHLSDSRFFGVEAHIGEKDYDLMKRLIRGGEPHRKFMRQIFVSVDITAPIYWWSEFDTYGVGVTKNSTSTMHKLTSRPIEMDDYQIDMSNLSSEARDVIAHLTTLTGSMNELMKKYNETKDMGDFRVLKQGLATSYMQKRTVTLNYEVLSNMVRYRKNHRLSEWSTDFMNWVKELPYSELILMSAKEPGEVVAEAKKAERTEIASKIAEFKEDMFRCDMTSDCCRGASRVFDKVDEILGGALGIEYAKLESPSKEAPEQVCR